MNKCRPWNLCVCKRYVTVCGGGCLDAAAILFLLLKKKKNPFLLVYFFSALCGSFPLLAETFFSAWSQGKVPMLINQVPIWPLCLAPSGLMPPIVTRAFLHLVPFFASLSQVVSGSCSSDVSSGDELLSWLFFSPSGIIKSRLSPYWLVPV